MIDLGNRTILDDGTVICRVEALMDMLYSGIAIDNVVVEPDTDITLYNSANKLLDTNYNTITTTTTELYKNVDWFEYWTTPDPWASLNIEQLCLERCTTKSEQERVIMEITMFRERNMEPVLRHLVYLVDHWRQHNIMWGVGRGSSVSSFILFLIGINRINPLEFDLDIREFLK